MAPSKPPSTGDDAGGTAGKASTSKAAARPYPIEVALADGTVLRGLEHPADGPPLLFVHDLGDDLDAWGSVAARVNAEGFRVIRLELRGHGLSDGEPDPSATMDDLTGALAEVAGAFGPAGLVAYGAAARAAFNLGTGHGAPVHALISPTPGSGDGGNLHRGDGENLHRGDGNPDSENLHRGDGNPDSENLHRGDGNPDRTCTAATATPTARTCTAATATPTARTCTAATATPKRWRPCGCCSPAPTTS